MTFDELVTEVNLLTNRPDLVAEVKSAVKAATLKAHRVDFFSKDIHEQGIQFDTEEFRHSFDYVNLISNFRAFKYLRIVKDELDDAGTFLEIITPEEILDSFGVNRNDIAYVAGRVIEIRSRVKFQFALLGAYVNPIITEVGFSSWVAEQFPFAIIYEAARVIYRSIGQLEESTGMGQLLAEEYAIVALSSIQDVGY